MKKIHIILIFAAMLAVGCSKHLDTPSQIVLPTGPDGTPMVALGYCPAVKSVSAFDPDAYDVYSMALHRQNRGWRYYMGESNTGYVPELFPYNRSNNLFIHPSSFFPYYGKMTFRTYAVPTGKKIKVNIPVDGTNADMVFDLTSEYLGSKYDGSYEVLYADNILMELSPNMDADDIQYLHFHRLQANLRFHITGANANTCDRITINSIKLDGATPKAVATYHNTTEDVTWSDFDYEDCYVINLENHTIDPVNGLDAGEGIYIAPTATRQKIVINYTLANGSKVNGQYMETLKRTMNYVVGEDDAHDWKAGYRYQYNIRIDINSENILSIDGIEVKKFKEGSTGKTEI